MFLSPEKHRSNARASPTERFENDSLKFVVSNRLSNPPIIHNSLVMIVHRSPPRDENDEIHPHLGQGTGPINARSLPQHCKNSRVESAEKIYERPRGKSRGGLGRSKIALVARFTGAETGGVASLRPWQIAIYEQ